MNLTEYSNTQFSRDFAKLNISKFEGNSYFNINEVEDKIQDLVPSNKAYFYFCLFISSCADQNMYSHFKHHYENFRNISKYPKLLPNSFSAVGKPATILDTAISLKIDFDNITKNELEQFIDTQFQMAPLFLGNSISVKTFFEAMINDSDFQHDSNVFNALVEILNSKIAKM